MKNIHFFPFLLFLAVMLFSSHVSAQSDSATQRIIDNTPIYDLDYHLTNEQFYHYYGVDDTSNAIITMFIRKRGSIANNYCLIPGASCLLGGIVIVLTGLSLANSPFAPAPDLVVAVSIGYAILLVGVIVEPIFFTINRAKYTRQNLLYTLAERERGRPLPDEIIEQLKASDFQIETNQH